MPGFPGAQCSSVMPGLCASFHASACSRPPDPTTSTFTRRLYSCLRTAGAAQESGRMTDPGLDLHEWQTRWAELEEAARDSPAEAASEMDRLVEQMLEERGYSLDADDAVDDDPEVVGRFRAARELANTSGDTDADPGDVAAAIESYRELFEHIVTEHPSP